MILSLLAIALTLLAAVFLLRLVRGSVGERRIRSLDDVNGLTVPVDLESFQNLISASEDAYLRSVLAPKAYRKMQRMRAHATLEYLRT